MAMVSALEINSLRKHFLQGFWRKKKEVLDGVSFRIPLGETTGFVGSNGSGKTTTIKCVLGFLIPNSGSIRFFGEENQASEISEKVRMQIGYLPERPYYYDFLTAEEFLRFHWRLSGAGAGFLQAADEVLSRVKLSHVRQQRLRSFSKGMLQRIGMAQALLRKPKVLVLDEPMSGLDPDGRLMMKEIIGEEKSRGTTVFFSSHLLGDMEELCKNVVVIDRGKILYEGLLRELVAQQNHQHRILYRELGKSEMSEILVRDAELQDAIDQLRKNRSEVLRIGATQVGLELAFSQLVQKARP